MTEQECTPKFKPGDWFWERNKCASLRGDGALMYYSGEGCVETILPECVIPDSPALPAVARWLAEHGAEPLSLAVEDALNSHPYVPSHVPALRALIAALTTEGV